MQSSHYGRSSRLEPVGTVFGWSFFAWLVAAGVALLIAAAVVSAGGREETDHFGPVPSGVVQLTADSYLLQDTRVEPDAICAGSNSDGYSIETQNRIPALDATFIECAEEQRWNTQLPASPTYGQSLGQVAFSPWYFIPAGAALALVFLLTALQGLAWRRQERQARREAQEKARAEAEAKQLKAAEESALKHLDLEQKRRELVRAYAEDDDFTDAHFEAAMAKLYAQGLQKAT